MVRPRIPEQQSMGRTEKVRAELERRITDLERTDGAQMARPFSESEMSQLPVNAGRIVGVLQPDRGGTGTPNAYSNTITGTTRQLYVSQDGTLTIGASSRRFKQDIADWQPAIVDLMRVRPRRFRWRSDVLSPDMEALARWEDDGGTAAGLPELPYEYGLIAEECADAGLEWLVRRDPVTGEPEGVFYERLPVAMLGAVSEQTRTLLAFAERIDAITSHINAIVDVINRLTGWLPAWLSPPKLPTIPKLTSTPKG